MTPGEVAAVAAIVATADGGCGHCVGQLAESLHYRFPEVGWPEAIAAAFYDHEDDSRWQAEMAAHIRSEVDARRARTQ